MGYVIERKLIPNLVQTLKKDGKKVILTHGTFDLFHYGHAYFLEQSKKLGDILIVGVDSDKRVQVYKGKGRPIIKEADRAHLISTLDFVDFVFILDDKGGFAEDYYINMYAKTQPAVVTFGTNFGFKAQFAKKQNQLKHVKYVEINSHFLSSSEIISRILGLSSSSSTKEKIRSFEESVRIVKELKLRGKSVGLITGVFDILHVGHLEFFRFAKAHADVLVVGAENDESVRLSKGKDRPVNTLSKRLDLLSELENVDLVFPILTEVDFKTSAANKFLDTLAKKIAPDFIFANPSVDKYWKNKERRAKLIKARLIKDNRPRTIESTTKIIAQIIEAEL